MDNISFSEDEVREMINAIDNYLIEVEDDIQQNKWNISLKKKHEVIVSARTKFYKLLKQFINSKKE